MILPEHRRAMLEQEHEQLHFVPRPVMEMSETIGTALAERRLITLQVYEKYGPREVTLLPKKFDEVSRSLVGLSQLGEERVRIALEDILDVESE